MLENQIPRSLSHDEKKAAEAAFSGRPFNAAWSVSARLVYDGILKALPQCRADTSEPFAIEPESNSIDVHADSVEQDVLENAVPTSKTGDREEAIKEGKLIDVTATAKQLGMS